MTNTALYVLEVERGLIQGLEAHYPLERIGKHKLQNPSLAFR